MSTNGIYVWNCVVVDTQNNLTTAPINFLIKLGNFNPDISSLIGSRYIQYRVIFERVENNIAPKLNSVVTMCKEAILSAQEVVFRVFWQDEDSNWIDETTGEEKVRVYIRSTSNITSGGCEANATTYCSTTNSTQNPTSCSYNTSSIGTFNYYMKVFDDENAGSTAKNGSFSVE